MQRNPGGFTLILLVSVAALFIAGGVSAARGPLVGGWSPIPDLNEPHVKEIAEYAVATYNEKQKSKLKLVKVVSGEQQVVSGMNYRLVLEVADGTAKDKYKAVVWEKAWENKRNLTSFERVQV